MRRATKALRPEPKYLQLAQRLRDDIASGRLGHGDRLESLAEMHARYGVTRPTVERAHGILEREGLIERVQGRGTFVTARAGAGAEARAVGVMQLMVAVLTIRADSEHSQGGWAEYIGLGAMRELRHCGLHTLSLSPDGLREGGLEMLLESRPRGVVITDLLSEGRTSAEFASILRASGVPLAVYGGDPRLEGLDHVASDHEAGAYVLARWLIGQGRRRIAQVWPREPHNAYWLAARDRGYRRALAESGLEPLEPIVIAEALPEGHGPQAFERGVRAHAAHLAELLLGPRPLDALMVHSDGNCFEVAAACRACGREPNRDVAIVGYDNYWAEAPGRRWESAVPLATVDKHNAQAGAELVRLLLDRAAGRLPPEPQRRVVKPQLVITPQPARP